MQLSAADARPVQFRVASRVGSMDVGIDFEFTGQVSLKREIHITVTSQTHVIYGENESLIHPVFAGEPVRQEIITAEGSYILVAGLDSFAGCPAARKHGKAAGKPYPEFHRD